jgi:cellulose synthase/poly-beta-1,6-N-acetylglucosamine synthase-like glycosyltransferase
MLTLNIIQGVLACYFIFFVCYCFIFSFIGKFKTLRSKHLRPAQPGNFAIIIPAYAEDNVLENTVSNCLNHNYPHDHFEVIIAGEAHEPATIAAIEGMGAKYVHCSGKKGEAIEAALIHVSPGCDFAVILDADNVMAKDCLHEMNKVLQAGFKVVQGRRTGKNTDSPVELLDTVREEIENHIFRKAQRAAGFSSALIGSGMGFHLSYLKFVMTNVEGIWEDREMELRILSDGTHIEYLEEAVIYDEKVSRTNVFLNQRTKWIAGHIKYIGRTIQFFRKAKKFNMHLFNKLLQALCPPRSLLLGAVFLFFLQEELFSSQMRDSSWTVYLLLYAVSLMLAIPKKFLSWRLVKAVVKLPLLLLIMFAVVPLSVFKMKAHYHTPHTK